MLQTILTVLWWLLIGLSVLSVSLWIYRMITNKEFRDAEFESARKAQRERERKNAVRRNLERKRLDNYYRTGNRRYLYDDDFKG